MKPMIHLRRAAEAPLLGVLVALAGCNSAPVRQSTLENTYAPLASAHSEESFEAPAPIRTVLPQYPFGMRREGIPGAVELSCTVDENGNVQDIVVVKSSDRAFEEPAVDALRQWKFKPAQREGHAVATRVKLPMQFKLRDD